MKQMGRPRERVAEAKAGEARGPCAEGWGVWECWEQLQSQESVSVTTKCGRGLGTPDGKRKAWKVLSDVMDRCVCRGSLLGQLLGGGARKPVWLGSHMAVV